MPQRQLNVRSDEAYERATRLARRRGATTTEIVVEARRAYDQRLSAPDRGDLTVDQQSEYESLRSLGRDAAAHKVQGARSEHDWLYDEHGLPR